jgi:hypothetical protein
MGRYRNTALQNKIVSFIWSITDDCVRDVYVYGKYRKIPKHWQLLRTKSIFRLIAELLNSVYLSTYGLERVQLNFSIALDDATSELDPQNPNARGLRTLRLRPRMQKSFRY